MDRLSGQTVHHADAERRERILVGSFPDEQAQGLLDEGVEAFLRRKITGIAGNGRPKKCRHINRVMAGLGLHQGNLAAHIILDTLQLLPVVAPCKDIAVRTDGSESLAVRLVQILLNPFTVDLVGTAVTGQRVHVAGGLLELSQVLRRIIYEEILVHDMVAREQYPYRRSKGEAAIAAVRGQPFITAVRTHG